MVILLTQREEKCFLCGEAIKVNSHAVHYDGWLPETQGEYGWFNLHPHCASRLARMIERDSLQYSHGNAIADKWYRGQMEPDAETSQELARLLNKLSQGD
jgi:hypothetical protein